MHHSRSRLTSEETLQEGTLLKSYLRRMSLGGVNNDWSFSPVYALLQNLSTSGEDLSKLGDRQTTEKESDGDSSLSLAQPVTPDGEGPVRGLGNLDLLFIHLQLPLDVPPPVVVSNYEDHPFAAHSNGNVSKEPKIVKWRDEIDGADLEDNQDAEDSLRRSRKTKTQRKKANRKLRKALAGNSGSCTAIGTTSSENESEKENINEKIIDRRKVIYQMTYGNTPPSDDSLIAHRYQVLKRPQLPTDTEAWPVAQPHALNGNHLSALRPAATAHQIVAANKATLIAMLHERFPDERQYLDSVSLVPHASDQANAAPEGLHIFIDASNIMIGFHDALKASLSLHKDRRIPRQPFSFYHLSLLLTRGRPTSKLILVGSDNFPAIAEAKSLGYETNILDRVHKAKSLTPRQKHFSKSGSKGDLSGGSGSETGFAAAFADKKWVEQAVDELLHLKMMESLVDVEEPGTMVVGSGDAAEAEYSAGFLKMVERALVKGWKVEVACFRANTSGMYRRKEFREQWGQRFKLVELDDFVQVLLGME